jgi:hypothetical protein
LAGINAMAAAASAWDGSDRGYINNFTNNAGEVLSSSFGPERLVGQRCRTKSETAPTGARKVLNTVSLMVDRQVGVGGFNMSHVELQTQLHYRHAGKATTSSTAESQLDPKIE